MEGRKVQRVGYCTFAVSLPKNWVKEVGIKQGDMVMFVPQTDGSLKVMTSDLAKRVEETKEFVINLDLCDEQGMLERIIVGNYTLGRDVLRIVSSKRIQSRHTQEIRKIAHRLFGLGIVEQTPNQIILQCSIDPTKFQIDMLIRRLSLIASTMQCEAIQAFIELDDKLAEDVISLEDEADMMYWLALRLLLSAQHVHAVKEKIGLKDPSEILYYGLVIRYLELVADYAENIARSAIEFKTCCEERVNKHITNRIDNLSELAHNVFMKAVECLFTGDMQIANNILEMRNVIKEEHKKLMGELPETPYLRAIVWGLVRIADNGAGIAAIAVNRALEKPSKICLCRRM
jgi:phosphate uptake regulator